MRTRELARVFLKLGLTSFGGPAVHIAMMEDEVVTRRQWLTRQQFLDLVGATNLIPGPNSTEMAIHVGHAHAGWPGLLTAGVCFILPSTILVTALAWAYVTYGTLPAADAILFGLKPVVIAIVAQALWRLGRTAVTGWRLALIGLAALAAAAAGLDEILILAAAGIAAALSARHVGPAGVMGAFSAAASAAHAAAAAVASTGVPAVGLWPLFAFFTKIGAVLFGSGYVLLAFLHRGLVVERGWLTEAQLLDAVAIGQVTPGPLSTTATFVGYLVAGGAGATIATVGIFLPAFVFVAISAPLVPYLRRSRTAGSVLDGINVASLALMAVVTWQLASAALTSAAAIVVAVVSAVLLVKFRVNAAWLALAGAAAGLALQLAT